MNPALRDLDPACYASYRDPRDYILSWTDEIWVRQTPGLIRDHYGEAVKIHTAYAETYDRELVIQNSLQKMAAGLKPVIDTVIKLEEFPKAIERLRGRDVFGKIVARLD